MIIFISFLNSQAMGENNNKFRGSPSIKMTICAKNNTSKNDTPTYRKKIIAAFLAFSSKRENRNILKWGNATSLTYVSEKQHLGAIATAIKSPANTCLSTSSQKPIPS